MSFAAPRSDRDGRPSVPDNIRRRCRPRRKKESPADSGRREGCRPAEDQRNAGREHHASNNSREAAGDAQEDGFGKELQEDVQPPRVGGHPPTSRARAESEGRAEMTESANYDIDGKRVPPNSERAVFRAKEVAIDTGVPAPPDHASLAGVEYRDVHAIDRPN